MGLSLIYDPAASRVQVDAAGLAISDTFGRIVSGGWDTAESGQVWSFSGGVAGDYSVPDGVGRHSMSVVNSARTSLVGTGIVDVDQTVRIIQDVTATGSFVSRGLVWRRDGSNFYRAEARFDPDGTVDVVIVRLVSDVVTTLATAANVDTYAPVTRTTFNLRFQKSHGRLRAKLWHIGDVEPGAWDADVAESSLTGGGLLGVRSFLNVGNTNTLPLVLDYDVYKATFVPAQVLVERTVDNETWATVRRGAELPSASGAATVFDYEFGPDVRNTYRVSAAAVATLPMTGQLVTAGDGNGVELDVTGLNVDLTGRALRLTLTIDKPLQVGNLNFFLGIGGLVNNIKWRFDAETLGSRIAKPGERFQVGLQLAEINTVAGSITLSGTGVPSTVSGFTDARMQCSDDGTTPVTLTLHKVEVVPVAVPGAYVSVVFDDSDASITTLAYPKMSALGFAGTDYVIVSSLGNAGKSTLAEVQTRAGAGWEIGGHAYDGSVHGSRLTGVTSTVARADLVALYAWLDANFPHVSKRYSFAYPGGRFEDTTDGHPIERLVRQAGFCSGRTILADVGTGTHVQIATPRPLLPFRLNAMSGISSLSTGQFDPANLTAAGGMLDKVAANGGWLILVFHKIVAGVPAATTEISQSDFDSIMDALANKGLTVLPVREVLDLHAATVTPTLGSVWLKSTSDPSLNRPVTVVDWSDVGRPSRSGMFDVVSRRLPVAVTEVRGSRRWTLDVLAQTAQEAEDLDELLDTGEVLFVQVPAAERVPGGYVLVADTSERRPGRRSTRRVLSLPMTEVAAPA